jgi:hypothetical protein
MHDMSERILLSRRSDSRLLWRWKLLGFRSFRLHDLPGGILLPRRGEPDSLFERIYLARGVDELVRVRVNKQGR